MSYLNSCTFIGRVASDIESKALSGGEKMVSSFRLAIDRGKDQPTDFLNIEVWDKLAQTVDTYLEKGRLVAIQAQARTESWEDKESCKKMSKVKFVGNVVRFLSSGKKDD